MTEFLHLEAETTFSAEPFFFPVIEPLFDFQELAELEKEAKDIAPAIINVESVVTDEGVANESEAPKVEAILHSAAEHAKNLKENYHTIAEKSMVALELVGAIGSIIRLAAAACPHCAAVAVQAVASTGKAFNLGGLGHWHADGTYHEGDHSTVDPSQMSNPFKWLEIDNTPSMFRWAA